MIIVQRQLHFRPDGFPSGLCCNCGTTEGLRIVEQRTERQSHVMPGGGDAVATLRLPFCAGCAPTARRAPLSTGNVVALCLLAAVAGMIVGLVTGDGRSGIDWWSVGLWALAAAAITSEIAWLVAKPRGARTSQFQPVRLLGLKRAFVSGDVKAVVFGFTNPAYLQAFEAANRDAIARKVLVARKA